MLQYMTHAEHGRMPVYNPTEVEFNQKNGWVLETKDVAKAKSLSELYFAKFGKKPHHRMKDETIKAALDGSTE